MERKIFIIEGNNFSNFEQFYDEVEKVLTKGLTWKIGRNLNALDDVLEGGFGRFDYGEAIRLIWKNADKSKLDLGWSETVKYIEDKLKTCHPTNIEYVKEDLAKARDKKGKILFEIIVDIIKKHNQIELLIQ